MILQNYWQISCLTFIKWKPCVLFVQFMRDVWLVLSKKLAQLLRVKNCDLRNRQDRGVPLNFPVRCLDLYRFSISAAGWLPSMKLSSYFDDLPAWKFIPFPRHFTPRLDTFEKHLFLLQPHKWFEHGFECVSVIDINIWKFPPNLETFWRQSCTSVIPRRGSGVSNFSNFTTWISRLNTKLKSVQNQSNLVKMILTNYLEISGDPKEQSEYFRQAQKSDK